jgi:hypothetical protein
MSDPTAAQHSEMLDLMKQTHGWIDSLMVAGIPEKVIVPAMFTALCERHLRASGDVTVTVEWLQRHADMMLAMGPAMLAAIREQHG